LADLNSGDEDEFGEMLRRTVAIQNAVKHRVAAALPSLLMIAKDSRAQSSMRNEAIVALGKLNGTEAYSFIHEIILLRFKEARDGHHHPNYGLSSYFEKAILAVGLLEAQGHDLSHRLLREVFLNHSELGYYDQVAVFEAIENSNLEVDETLLEMLALNEAQSNGVNSKFDLLRSFIRLLGKHSRSSKSITLVLKKLAIDHPNSSVRYDAIEALGELAGRPYKLPSRCAERFSKNNE
jgi:HEAT repeat protein